MTTSSRPTPAVEEAALLDLPPADLAARGASLTAGEISRQPRLWREVAATAALRRAEAQAFLSPLLDLPELRIVLTGAGTSAFAGQVLAPALTQELRRRVEAVPTTDIVSNPREVFGENVPTLLVSFARSGDSPESRAATRLAAQCLDRVHHLVVTCNPEGELARDHAGAERSFVLLMPEESNDQGFAMTSSFTCMVLAGWLTLRPGAAGPAGQALAESLARAGEEVLATGPALARELAARGYQRVVYLGSGPLAGLARESALKLLELTAGEVVSYFDSPLGFRHGPKSVLDHRTLAVVYLSNDAYTRRYDEDVVAELREGMGVRDVLVAAARPSEGSAAHGEWRVSGLDRVDDVALCLPFVLLAQLFALHASLARGRTPDNPFPSGEVNRVVQGVTVHPLDIRR